MSQNIVIHRSSHAQELSVRNLVLLTPPKDGGLNLIAQHSRTFLRGERVLLTGPSGCGKSCLLRALMGLWPYGSGEVIWPKDAKILCIPQQPYLPDLPVRGIMAYPHKSSLYSDRDYQNVLEMLGLDTLLSPYMKDSSMTGDELSRILSGGQQQRLRLARVFLQKPDILLLDEVTSAVDPEADDRIHKLLVKELPYAAIINIAHRPGLIRFHNTHARIEKGSISYSPPKNHFGRWPDLDL